MRTKLFLLPLLVLAASLVGACGDDGPKPGNDAGTDSSIDAGPDSGPDGGPDGGDDGGCTPTVVDGGCWSCPQETIQFLNQCNDGYCSAFDNTRITYPGYTPGGPYPAIP